MAKRPQIDWEGVEREYRAGQLSVRAIATMYGCTEGAIRKRAKKHGWRRDLTKRVQQSIREGMVREDAEAVRKGAHQERGTSNEDEASIIELAGLRGREVIYSHRKTLGASREMVDRLLSELDATTTHVGKLEQMIEDETRNDHNNTRRNSMLKAVSLPSRSGVLRDLSQSLRALITVERQAFNLDKSDSDAPTTASDEYRDLTDEELNALERRLTRSR